MAILSIILPEQREWSERRDDAAVKKASGAYVISETHDGWFVFGIYDSKRRHLINSTYAYDSIEKAKEEINSCRESGAIAETEDRSGRWIQEKYIPKFVLTKNGEEYEFYLRVIDKESIIRSEKFKNLNSCMALLERVKANVESTDVYMSVDKVSPDGYKKWGLIVEEPVIEESVIEEIIEEPVVEEEAIVEEIIEEIIEEPIVEEEPIIEEPVEEEVVEEPFIEEVVVEEPELPKKRIVGILWPESANPDKLYRYNADEAEVEVGDIVVVPTFDSFKQKEVIRKAPVVKVELYQDGDDVVLPKKSIIAVEKASL